MSTIKNKLYSLERTTAKTSQPATPISENSAIEILKANKIENEFGSFLLREKEYPLAYKHSIALSGLNGLNGDSLSILSKDISCQNLKANDLLFIDTETTGLAGGSGTYAFLIGIGFLDEEAFKIKQYFMHSFESERAILWDLVKVFQQYRAFVSFNGKSYDVPLIRSRFILNKLKINWEQFNHIDLLHSSRRFWKTIYPDNSLQGLEKNVLGFKRLDDIPGADIPKRFFDYVSTNSATNIKPVFQHNVMDILSLVSLLNIQNEIIKIPKTTGIKYDPIGLIKSYENIGWDLIAAKTAGELVSNEKNSKNIEILTRLSYIFKRLKQYDKAATIWEKIIGNYQIFNPHIYIELAKYMEHNLRDYPNTLNILERLLKRIELLQELKDTKEYAFELNQLLHRRQRVIWKMNRNKEKS